MLALLIVVRMSVQKEEPVHQEIQKEAECHTRHHRGNLMMFSRKRERLGHEVKKGHRHHRTGAKA